MLHFLRGSYRKFLGKSPNVTCNRITRNDFLMHLHACVRGIRLKSGLLLISFGWEGGIIWRRSLALRNIVKLTATKRSKANDALGVFDDVCRINIRMGELIVLVCLSNIGQGKQEARAGHIRQVFGQHLQLPRRCWSDFMILWKVARGSTGEKFSKTPKAFSYPFYNS